MRHETGFRDAFADVDALNARYAHLPAEDVLRDLIADSTLGRVALVSSFGAESVVLLHLVSRIDPALPVLFVDTEMLFPETLTYQREVAGHLGLSDVRRIAPAAEVISKTDPDGRLHLRNPDACCHVRKTATLERALAPFDSWITGRKRFQSGGRADLTLFEREAPSGRLKLNPLAGWRAEDLRSYMDEHDLPRHPLVAKGFASIGCAPCTSPVAAGEDPRAGRWRGLDKDECGIHFENGRIVRGPLARAS